MVDAPKSAKSKKRFRSLFSPEQSKLVRSKALPSASSQEESSSGESSEGSIGEPQVKKQRVQDAVTRRLRVDLTCDRENDEYPEFSFAKLLAEEESPNEGNLNDEDEQVKRLAAYYEKKFGGGGGGSGKRKRMKDVTMDYGYDVTDSFIDDSEAADEVIPDELDTQHGGFYVNCGDLMFKKVPITDSEEDAAVEEENKERKKQEEVSRKQLHKKMRSQKIKEKYKNVVKKKKKSAKIVESDSEVEIITKETVPAVAEKAISEPKTSAANSPVKVKKSKSVSSDTTKSKADKASGKKTKTREVLKRAREEIVNRVKKNSPFGMEKFPLITQQLISIEFELRRSHTISRKSFYEGLYSEIDGDGLTISYKELKTNAATALNRSNETKLREVREPLEKAVAPKLAAQVESYGLRLEAYAERLEAWRKAKEELPEGEEPELAKPKGVYKKTFKWDTETRRLFGNLVTEKETQLKISRLRADEQTDLMKKYLATLMESLWPGGWMTLKTLLKEAELSSKILSSASGKVASKEVTAKKKPAVTVNPLKTVAKPKLKTENTGASKQQSASKPDTAKSTVSKSSGTTKSVSSQKTSRGSSPDVTVISQPTAAKPELPKTATPRTESSKPDSSSSSKAKLTKTETPKSNPSQASPSPSKTAPSLAPVPVISKSGSSKPSPSLDPVSVVSKPSSSKPAPSPVVVSKSAKASTTPVVSKPAKASITTAVSEPGDKSESPVPVITESAALLLQSKLQKLKRQTEKQGASKTKQEESIATNKQEESSTSNKQEGSSNSNKQEGSSTSNKEDQGSTSAGVSADKQVQSSPSAKQPAAEKQVKSAAKQPAVPTPATSTVESTATKQPSSAAKQATPAKPPPTVNSGSKQDNASNNVLKQLEDAGKRPATTTAPARPSLKLKPKLQLTRAADPSLTPSSSSSSAKPTTSLTPSSSSSTKVKKEEQVPSPISRTNAAIQSMIDKANAKGRDIKPTIPVIQKPTAKRPAPQAPTSTAAPSSLELASLSPEIMMALIEKYAGSGISLDTKNMQTLLKLEIQQAQIQQAIASKASSTSSPICTRAAPRVNGAADVITIDDDVIPFPTNSVIVSRGGPVPKTSPIKIVSSQSLASPSPVSTSSPGGAQSRVTPSGTTPRPSIRHSSLAHSLSNMMKSTKNTNLSSLSSLHSGETTAMSSQQQQLLQKRLQLARLQNLATNMQSLANAKDKGSLK